MTLEGLARALESLHGRLTAPDAEIVERLLAAISAWKKSAETPERLGAALDRSLGQSWFTTDALHRQVYQLLQEFQQTIDTLGGMTMNERLVMFDLMDRWDRSSEEERDVLYAKLGASRGGPRSARS